MKILKFGGTSVAHAENILKVVAILKNQIQNEPRLIVVVSAMGGITDLLLAAAENAADKKTEYKAFFETVEFRHFEAIRELIPIVAQSAIISHTKRTLNHLETLLDGCFLLGELSKRTKDGIISFGELLSSYIITEALKVQGLKAVLHDSRKLIQTNDHFGKAVVDFEVSNILIKQSLATVDTPLVVVPGFIACTQDGHTTTLGRGGSDYTAAILAAALQADLLEIWTDVSGMYTANPKLVKHAYPITDITYQEAMELSHFGAKVLYPPTIQPVFNSKIPIAIKNTFAPLATGTLITEYGNPKSNPIKGITHIDKITLLTIEGSGIIGVSGTSKRIFEALGNKNISVIFITQASSEYSICIGISDADTTEAKKALDTVFAFEISQFKITPCAIESGLSIIAVVGENMKNYQGLSGSVFSTLGRNNINVRAIAQGASERNISAVIQSSDAKKAINSLHEKFFEEDSRQLNLFVMGVGNVGERFIAQIMQQKHYLKEHHKITIRIIALSNSRKMIFDEDGISLKNWQADIENGIPSNIHIFQQKVKAANFRNSIFIDNTASSAVAESYSYYIENSIAVVTCNKIACSSSFEKYKQLKNLSRKFNAPFLYETNVGAGLPIIDTVKNLMASGDKIHTIQAVLSGSLNFIFNNFNTDNSFYDIVQQAQKEGYTEPDPKIDLSGVDVMRKILILARESGLPMEMEAIENISFLPEASLSTDTVADFLSSLATNSLHFESLLLEANEKKCRLKYVAQLKNGKASVGLQQIPKDHPFYAVEGKDNIVLLFTERYNEQPLLIKGAGAGAAVTASGIFADVIRIGNN